MSKHTKKTKGARPSQEGLGLDETTLLRLTSNIEQNLSSKSENKRKHPPTIAAESQKKRQRQRGDAGRKISAKASSRNDELLSDIKALGGDERDLELIGDVNSSDEDDANDNSRPFDQSLKDELLAFSKELGLADHQPSEASEIDEDLSAAGTRREGGGPAQEAADAEAGSLDEEGGADGRLSTRRKPGDLIFEPRADWHAAKLPPLHGPTTNQVGPFTAAMESLKKHAKMLLDQDAERYRSSVFASASHKFLATIMSSGTLTDKVSALTLAIQESPLHNVRAFDALMSLASKKSRGQAIGAIGALVDLLGPGTLLPPDRRLRPFHSQAGLLGTLQQTSTKSWTAGQALPGRIREAHLVSWVYEDWLKETFFKIIQLLETWCSDEIEYSRTRALDFVYGLLKEKPEQESNLLRLLVNKLGDRDRKISSRASYLLLQLQNSHPGMKPIILRTVEQEIILHPSQDHRSKYSAINTLNQTILSSKETTVAESLIRTYFDLFVTLLKSGSLGIGEALDIDESKVERATNKRTRKSDPPSKTSPSSEQAVEAADKLVSAILTGVNRAAPFVGASGAIMDEHLDTLFTIAHSTNFNTGIQALLLIQHLSMSRNMAMDRFYRTLYESLLDPRLVTSSKQALYLNLLLRSLKNDVDVRRVKAFAKRMLQVAGLHQPPFICGLLYVICQLRETFPDLSTLIEDPEESIFDDEAAAERPVYDGRKRDPEHSNAHRSCLWELITMRAHFHPSVTVLAQALADREQQVQKPDLESHSLIRFLDRFVYRNPKSTETARGASIMQPLKAAKDVGDIWLGSKGAGSAAPSVNSSAFRTKRAEDVAAEDVFFHNYFQQVGKESKKSAKTAQAEGDAEGDEEDAIWKALVSTQPDIEDEGSDVGFDDLDEEDMASASGSSPGPSFDGMSDDGMSVGSDASEEFADDDDDGGEDHGGEADVAQDEKEDAKAKKKARRKAMKNLPTFASADDYAQLLEGEDEA